MAYRRSSYARKATHSRQKRARFNQVRMSRAGYGASMRTKFARNLMPTSAMAEIKTVDGLNTHAAVNTLTLNTTGLVTPVNLIQVGSGFNNRVGRKIELQSIHLLGVVTQTGHTTIVNDYARILIVYDRQTNGATPAFTDILQNYDQSTTAVSGPFCGLNPDERERYLILADIHLSLPAVVAASGLTGASDGAVRSFNINRFVKLRNLQTHYKADSSPAVVGDIATGALHIVTVGSLASGSEGFQFTGTWRIRYKDT